MSQIQIAERYAKSLIDLSQEKDLLEKTYEDIQTVTAVCHHLEFKSMLNSPVIYTDKKLNIFKELFQNRIQELSMQFFQLLIQKGRESALPQICNAFIEQYKSIRKIRSARITTAIELSQSELEKIKKQFSNWLKPGEIMELSQKVDSKILGGFIMEMGDQSYDASVKRQVEEFKVSLYDKSYINLVEKK